MSPRQRISLKTHIMRIREGRASLPKTDINGDRSNWKMGTTTPRVRGTVSSVRRCVTDIMKGPIAKQIILRSEEDWQNFRAASRTHEYLDQQSVTTYSSIDDCDRSTPPPNSDSDRHRQSETDRTSSCDSEDVLAQALEQKQKEATKLHAKCEQAETKRREEEVRYIELKKKYDSHIAQRKSDYAKVQDAWEYCKEAKEQCEELTLKLQDSKEEHKAQLRAKELELAQLKDKQQCAISVLEEIHKKELAAKEDEIAQAKALVAEKDEELSAATRKAAEERRDYKTKAGYEKRKLLNAAKVYREASEKEKDAQELRLQQVIADASDAVDKNETTITSLTARNLRLENENNRISRLLKQQFPTAERLWKVIDGGKADKEEAKKLRAELKLMKETNENLLDKIQQMQDQFTRHQQGEQNARIEADDLQRKCYDLEENLNRQKQQTRDVIKQLEQVQAGAVPAGTHCAALNALELENSQIRALYEAEQVANGRIQKDSDKLDDENLSLSMKHELTEADLIKLKFDHDTLKESTASSMQELEILREAAEQSGSSTLDDEAREGLTVLIEETNIKYKAIVEENAQLIKKVEELQKWGDSIAREKDKTIRELGDAASKLAHWYYDEAVPTTERLHDEIQELKAEKGETHYIESTPPRNPAVAERNVLRYAAHGGFAGVTTARIPSAAQDPNFIPDAIPATYEALLRLRPHGYFPLWDAGKVWLKREFSPLSEEEAAKRVEAQMQAIAPQPTPKGASPVIERRKNHYKPEVVKEPTKVLVPTQARKPPTALARSRSEIPLPIASISPPWESRFAKHITKENYTELESDNKRTFIEMYVEGGVS